VSGDGEWLRRLLINLLDNALKFTGDGGRVGVQVDRDGDRVTITVRDTGVGIAAVDRPHVFERFFRADPSRTSSTDGAGLGLSLAHWIVERHSGSIAVESEVGAGTTFTVSLPRTGIGPIRTAAPRSG
jgi:signal transduction histidine kinase